MAEPSTAAASTPILAGITLAALLPYVDANAAFGAVMGAALVATNKKDLSAWKRLLSFVFSSLGGYGGAGEFIARDWAKESFLPAFLVALVIVPIALRIIDRAPDLDLAKLRDGLAGLLQGKKE